MTTATATAHHDVVAEAIRWLDTHAADQPTLAEVADAVGMSPSHLQRVFTRWVGVSPKRFLQYLTAETARGLLTDDLPVLDAAVETGLSSPGRLHDVMVAVHAATPGQVRRRGEGVTIRHGIHPTPFGPAMVGVTDRGVCHLSFVEGDLDGALADLQARWPAATHLTDPDGTAEVVERAFAPLGTDEAGPVPLVLAGTNLQVQVWQALLTVPEGTTVTYGGLAAAIGRPEAVRAVAGAVAANRIAVLVPCHRVLRSTGALAGYRWGTDRKRQVLAVEAARKAA